MKPKNKPSRQPLKGPDQNANAEAAQTLCSPRIPPGRRWLFRVLAMFLVPLAVLVLLELSLRLAGYGHVTSFFLEKEQGGERVLIENDKFGWRFFPEGMARSPSPLAVRATKPPGVYRVFLFGESAALGDPKPAYGVGRYLETLLQDRFPGTKFEVLCVAMTAINSHAILPIARECARYQGDLWILYMGNNEMEGPFGASPVLGTTPQSLRTVRATLALRTTRVGQLLQNLVTHAKRGGSPPRSWEGMKMFLEHQLSPDDPIKQTVYANFRQNLEDIVNTAARAGARPLLCTVPGNLRDCAPFASAHRRGLSETDRANWLAHYERGVQLESAQQFQEAEQAYQQAKLIDPSFAELQFRAARCAEQLINYSGARAHYERARDSDALPFRTDTSLNTLIRDVAKRFANQGARLVDAALELASQSPHGITGKEFFHDHVHLTFDGNYRLARLMAQQLEGLLPPAILQQRRGDWAEAEVCEGRLGLSDWNRMAVFETMLQRLSEAPFTNQINHLPQVQALVDKITQTRARMHPRIFMETRAIYEESLAKNPSDHRLSENFAEFLEASGDVEEAIAQWRQVALRLSHHQAAFYHLGRLLGQQAKYPEARENFNKALALRPDLVEARIELGQLLLKQGKSEPALRDFEKALEMRPDDARVHVQKANAFVMLKRRAEAMASLREAVRIRPRYWEARYLLGLELAADDRFKEALVEFAEVTRLRPNYASGHFNLAVAMAKQGRLAEAHAEFRETLRLDPNHKAAAQYLQAIESTAKPNK